MDTFLDDQGRRYERLDVPERRGGQADVLAARGPDGVRVAIKWFRDAETGRREAAQLKRIAVEDRRASEWLTLPMAEGVRKERPFLVFPWAERSLSDALAGAPLRTRLNLLVQAARTVARLHKSVGDLEGYRVHRDIKPPNFLVFGELTGASPAMVKLADLGAARDGRHGDQATNTAVYSPHFAPAEQRLPLAQAPRESWDVFALAATVFLGLTGEHPLAALDAGAMVTAVGRDLMRLEQRRVEQGLGEADLAT